MVMEIPPYGLRAYALFYAKYGVNETFGQSALDWIVGTSMRKKIFSVLLRAGWIKKTSRTEYTCVPPRDIFTKLLDFKVPGIMTKANKEYAFTRLSAVEIWSDYSYVQRGFERSPYYIKVLRSDIKYWKAFFNRNGVPNYVDEGHTIGEFVILIPVDKIESVEKNNVHVDRLVDTMDFARQNDIYGYAYNYMRNKYGFAAS